MKYLLSLCLLLTTTLSFAQDFSYGSATHNDNDFDRNTIDSNANAVVLKEFGTARMQIDDATGRLVIIFEYHVKIKIFNKEGFKHADIVIPTYKDDNLQEYVQDVNAVTHNYINGNFVQTTMDKKALFTENRSKYQSLTKFTLPNIKEGSIIEYKYRIQSPLIFNFRSWYFQSDIPKVQSEYLVFIPANFNYNVSLKGFYKLTDQKADVNRECLRLSGQPLDCSKMTYIMKNVPAFIEEDYMTAASNFISAMHFELAEEHMLNGSKKSYTKTWKDVDFDLVGDKKLGSQMKRKDVFKEIVPEIIKDSPDDLSKAKAIYNYIKKQIKWNNYYGKYSEENIKSVIDSRSGNVADINLSLIAALGAANLDAEAVILSTRENGLVNKLYPVISDFNYVVAKVNIGEKSYLLDATEPLLPFGLLPLRCINDQGRVINLKKPSYWIDLKADQKSTTSYVLNGKLNAEGKIVGQLSTTYFGYAAFNKRREIKKFNSVDEYFEKIDERLTKTKISNHKISAFDSVEKPLIEVFDVEFSAHDGTSKSLFYISPFVVSRIAKNPFNLNDRTYPIDMGAASDERIVINIQLPEKLNLQEKPKDMAIGLPNNGGRYLLQTNLTDTQFSVNQKLQLNKAIYGAEEYLYLKEFYSKIIQNQKTDVLLKASN